jgi:hypothetical protein
MKIVVSSRDSSVKLTLADVACYYISNNTYHIVFQDGRERVYPFMHIWYIETIKE